MTSLNRRRFIGAAIGTGAAAATAGSWTPAASADGGTGNRSRGVPNSRIGIQLYTMREKMDGDRRAVRRVLNRLDAYGYSEVELAGYAGFTAQQFRALLDNAGLNAVSGHDALNIDPDNTTWQSDYQQTLENAKRHGPAVHGPGVVRPAVRRRGLLSFLAERMNEAGELAKAAGLQFFYHNHNFEFENKQADGTPFFDLLLAETEPELVKFELDLYWIIRGGQNPLEYLTDPRGSSPTTSRTARGATGRTRRTSRTSGRARSTSRTSSPWASAPRRSTTSSSTTRRGCRIPATRRGVSSPRAPGRRTCRTCASRPPGTGQARRYRWAWSFQVVRPQPEKSIPSIRRARRWKTLIPVLAWPASHRPSRCSGPNASRNSVRPSSKCSQP